MGVEIKFDANQRYQRDAIDSVVELFAGQETATQNVLEMGLGAVAGTLEGFQDVAFGNSLVLDPATIELNLRRVQDRVVPLGDGGTRSAIPQADRQEFTGDLDFSVEMETGTGKTYVYLRTVAELNQKYGFTKFVIVVPSVAIREGVLSNLRLLREHIRDEYDGLQYDANVYDSSRLGRVRSFATASHLQILVINIDSFTSDTNIINRPTDAMNGYRPIEFLRACRPIVVMDEPQNMETPTRQEAIRSLSPLVRLRYSATHRDLKHLVYRLTPLDAYDLRLVKRIGVLSVTKDEDLNEALIEVTRINATSGGVTATAKIHKATRRGTKLTTVTLHKDDDLFEQSGAREVYRGWMVEDIHAPRDGVAGLVEFANGVRIHEHEAPGGAREQQQRLMIRSAVEAHLEKELKLRQSLRRKVIDAPLKPLTLFFIDRVANYHPAESKFRVWFEEEYEALLSEGRFMTIREDMPAVDEVHDGYFAESAKGVPKDIAVGRDTKDAESAYERIMQKKEELLSLDEPLRFIFSHSALVEGWDNPNVFTICNLQDTNAEMRKRQQIGRGLRLPVMANGERCRDDQINILTVIAHERFAKFADDLQREIEEETGIEFSDRLIDLKKDRIKIALKEHVLEDPIFKELWARISMHTTYRMEFETDAVVAEAVRRIDALEPLEPIKFRVSQADVEITNAGVGAAHERRLRTIEAEGERRLPDLVGELSRRVPLSRATVVTILRTLTNLDQAKVNPSVFIDRAAGAMNEALYDQVADGIVYTPDGPGWNASVFKSLHLDETLVKKEMVVDVTKSVTDKIVCDSQIEVGFAKFLEERDDVVLFLKLPGWFLVATPLGNYNPDWAVVRKEGDSHYLYLIRETKGTDQIEALQWESEGWKIKFGAAHFKAIGVDYAFGSDPALLVGASRS